MFSAAQRLPMLDSIGMTGHAIKNLQGSKVFRGIAPVLYFLIWTTERCQCIRMGEV